MVPKYDFLNNHVTILCSYVEMAKTGKMICKLIWRNGVRKPDIFPEYKMQSQMTVLLSGFTWYMIPSNHSMC